MFKEKEIEKMNKEVIEFVGYVMAAANIDRKAVSILDYDLDRVYLAVDSTENNYTIRMWNIGENGIRYSLFKDGDTTEEVIRSQYYQFAVRS